ncbi:MAG: hypothetical protein FGM42_04630 [Ilumatobacteraceae bacterium]|nr:hypothetical protein [Ilumatobacteraceae bacterium]
MTISESARYEMHTGLRNRLGEPVADTLMEHPPPSGWSDMAEKSDVEHLRNEVNKRLDSLVHGVWAAVGIFSAAFIALFSLIAARG